MCVLINVFNLNKCVKLICVVEANCRRILVFRLKPLGSKN